MNKKLFIPACGMIFLFFNLTLFPCAVSAETRDDGDIEKIKTFINAPGDFTIEIKVNGEKVEGAATVDGATAFEISRVNKSAGINSYKLYYFLDGRIRRIVDEASLPYKFTRTYRGLFEGSYEVSFVLKDALGNHGSYTVTLDVKH